MKHIAFSATLFIIASSIFLSSCEKDAGILPNISFKTGANYISGDTTLPAGTNITIGINASKSEDKDVLTRFDITKTIDTAAGTSVYNTNLTGTQGDTFSYDFTTTVDNTPGQVTKYTFTIINRDGLINQVSLKVITGL